MACTAQCRELQLKGLVYLKIGSLHRSCKLRIIHPLKLLAGGSGIGMLGPFLPGIPAAYCHGSGGTESGSKNFHLIYNKSFSAA